MMLINSRMNMRRSIQRRPQDRASHTGPSAQWTAMPILLRHRDDVELLRIGACCGQDCLFHGEGVC
jgi:hypothetical protein